MSLTRSLLILAAAVALSVAIFFVSDGRVMFLFLPLLVAVPLFARRPRP